MIIDNNITWVIFLCQMHMLTKEGMYAYILGCCLKKWKICELEENN